MKTFLAIFAAAAMGAVLFGQSRVYEYSTNAPRSEKFTLAVDGKDCLVYPTPAGDIAPFDILGKATLRIDYFEDVKEAVVRPLSKKIEAKKTGSRTVELSLGEPCNISLEINGRKHPLFIFANPPAKNPDKKKSQMIFKAGEIYDVGLMKKIDSDTSVVVEGGAIVYGTFQAGDIKSLEETRNISISGNGIISGEKIPVAVENKGAPSGRELFFNKTRRLDLSGISVVQSPNWTFALFACEDVKVDNVKVVSQNSCDDGMDIVSCKNVSVENSFFRTKDDCIAIKAGVTYGGVAYFEKRADNSVENVSIKNCVLWNDIWGNALEIGFETRGDEIKNIVYENIDVINVLGTWGNEGVLTIHNGDRAKVSNVLYKDIRVEEAEGHIVNILVLNSKYSKDKKRGSVSGVRFENIRAESSKPLKIKLGGFDENSVVENIVFKNFTINSKPLKFEDIPQSNFVRGVTVED